MSHRGQRVGRSLLALLFIAGCARSADTPKPKSTVFHLVPGTVFLVEPRSEADICGILTEPKIANQIGTKSDHDVYGTLTEDYSGYSATQVGLCANDPDGVIWVYEGRAAAGNGQH
jgi:hypothetical protein